MCNCVYNLHTSFLFTKSFMNEKNTYDNLGRTRRQISRSLPEVFLLTRDSLLRRNCSAITLPADARCHCSTLSSVYPCGYTSNRLHFSMNSTHAFSISSLTARNSIPLHQCFPTFLDPLPQIAPRHWVVTLPNHGQTTIFTSLTSVADPIKREIMTNYNH